MWCTKPLPSSGFVLFWPVKWMTSLEVGVNPLWTSLFSLGPGVRIHVLLPALRICWYNRPLLTSKQWDAKGKVRTDWVNSPAWSELYRTPTVATLNCSSSKHSSTSCSVTTVRSALRLGLSFQCKERIGGNWEEDGMLAHVTAPGSSWTWSVMELVVGDKLRFLPTPVDYTCCRAALGLLHSTLSV